MAHCTPLVYATGLRPVSSTTDGGNIVGVDESAEIVGIQYNRVYPKKYTLYKW
jgi:hypothetical protein